MINASFDSPIMGIFVNNIKIMASKRNSIIEYIKTKLIFAFSMANIGPISFYLGMKIK